MMVSRALKPCRILGFLDVLEESFDSIVRVTEFGSVNVSASENRGSTYLRNVRTYTV